MFVQQVVKEIGEIRIKKHGAANLNNSQMKALHNLENNDTIVIKPFGQRGKYCPYGQREV